MAEPVPFRARSEHAYGPHDPASSLPPTVSILVGKRGYIQRAEHPTPERLIQQRVEINTQAHLAAKARAGG